MPHSLYLGSGIVHSRLRNFDEQVGGHTSRAANSDGLHRHQPSLAAIKFCLSYSVVELAICLFTFALFVNSSILVVAGAALSDNNASQTADLFGIHDLLSTSLAPIAGTLFALALLFSRTSAGIVCTMAGQMVSEGALNWTIAPWLRRLITRSVSVIPAIIIAASEGKDGLTKALNGTQIVLSVTLPFVSAPLIYFTCRDRYMVVTSLDDEGRDCICRMRNSWYTTTFGVLIWLAIAIMNLALLVLVGLGKA